MADASSSYETPRHPIQVVSTQTGLSKDVIRIWERRYQAITPSRSDTGRRLYADADIDRLLRLRKATSAGWRIGDIAGKSNNELDRLLTTELRTTAGTASGNKSKAVSDTAESYLSRCLGAIEEMNPSKLASLLSSASVAMSVPKLLDELVAPLLVKVGDLWHRGDLRIGHEHMASSVIRGFLDNLRESASMHTDGPTILVTTPSGQNHELGALMAAVAAATAGWRAIYLSPNMPSRDIVATAIELDARAIALGLAYPANDSRIASELRFLGQQLPAGITLIIGGEAAMSYRAALEEIGALYIADYKTIPEALSELREKL